jgi:ribonuclease HI
MQRHQILEKSKRQIRIRNRRKIGAAAHSPTKETLHQHLGSGTRYNVFTAEITALHLAADSIRNNEQTSWYIYFDSQAGIKAVANPRRQSGRPIIKEFFDSIDDVVMKNPNLEITIIWIPRHLGIEGNEKADKEASEGSENKPII